MTSTDIATIIGVAISFGMLWFRLGRFIGKMNGVKETIDRVSGNVSRLFAMHDARNDRCSEHGERLAALEQYKRAAERENELQRDIARRRQQA